jgi:hypothetical protein
LRVAGASDPAAGLGPAASTPRWGQLAIGDTRRDSSSEAWYDENVLAKVREQLQYQNSAPSESGKRVTRTFGSRHWKEPDRLTTTPLRHTNAYAIIPRRGGEHRGRA